MAALVHEDFELFYVVDGVATLGTSGPAQLEEQMAAYFEAHGDVRSELTTTVDGPRFASLRERVRWQHSGQERTQSSIAVYEIDGDSIRRVWYYGSEP